MIQEVSAMCFCLGVQIYVRKAVLDQQVRALMVKSSTPDSGAAVAAQILKVCPAYRH